MSKTTNTRKSPASTDPEARQKPTSIKASPARQKPGAPDVKSASASKTYKRSTAADHPTHASGSSTKLGNINEILRTKQGASIDQIAEAVGWQRHSVHGLISGKLRKKLGLNIVSERVDGVRIYRIVK